MDPTTIRRYIDYYFPREILGPVIVIFSAENVIDILFDLYMPTGSELSGWIIILIISILVIGYWGEADEDKDEFEDVLEDEGLKER